MSIDAMHWVRRQHVEAGAGAKWLLFLLADRADESWSCFPSIDLLVEETQLKPSTIRAHLRALEKQGLLACERQRNTKGRLGNYRYRVNPPLGSSSGPATAEKPQVEQNTTARKPHVDPAGASTAKSQQSPTPPKKLNPQREPKVPEANASGPLSPNEARRVLGDVGLPLLTAAGVSDRQARSFLGGLAKKHGAPAVADACVAAVASRPVEPRAWLAAACERPLASRPPPWLGEHAFTRPLRVAKATPNQRRWFEEVAGFGPQPQGVPVRSVMHPEKGWIEEIVG